MNKRQKKIKELREEIREIKNLPTVGKKKVRIDILMRTAIILRSFGEGILDLFEDEGEEKRVDRITRDFLKSSYDLHNARLSKPKKWKPEMNEKYFIVYYLSDPYPQMRIWENTEDDNDRYKIGNCFKTEELTIKACDEIVKLFVNMKKE